MAREDKPFSHLFFYKVMPCFNLLNINLKCQSFFPFFYGIIEIEDQSRDRDFENRPLEPTSSTPANFLYPENALDSQREWGCGSAHSAVLIPTEDSYLLISNTWRTIWGPWSFPMNLLPITLRLPFRKSVTHKCHPSAIFCLDEYLEDWTQCNGNAIWDSLCRSLSRYSGRPDVMEGVGLKKN